MTVTFSLILPVGVATGCPENGVAEEEEDEDDGVTGRTAMPGGGGVFRERKGETAERRAEDIGSHVPAEMFCRSETSKNRKLERGTFEMVSGFPELRCGTQKAMSV